MCPINCGVNFSDHLPISFVLAVSPVCVASSPSHVASDCSPPSSPMCNWSKAEQCNIDEYRVLISASLPCLSADLEHCCVLDCSKHKDALDSYSFEFIKCIVDSACHSIPCHSRPPGRTLAGWNHGPKQLRSQATRYGLKLVVHLMGCCPRLKREVSRGLSMLYGKSEGSKVISKGLGLLMRLVTKIFGLVLSEWLDVRHQTQLLLLMEFVVIIT